MRTLARPAGQAVVPATSTPSDAITPTQAAVGTAVAGGLVFGVALLRGAFWGAVLGAGVNVLSPKRRRSSRRTRS